MSIREQGRRIRLRRTGRVPPDAEVFDYDELDWDARAAVAELANGAWTAPEPADLEDGDVVRFTGYYRVRTR